MISLGMEMDFRVARAGLGAVGGLGVITLVTVMATSK